MLIGGAALLLLVLAAYIGLGRYKSLLVYQRLLKRSGVSLTHDTNGFTYSQSLQGRTIFTLHAAKATQLGSGKWALHDAELTLFDRAGNAADHVRGAEIDYDEKAGIARAQGVVDMDLQPPQSLAQGGRALPGTTLSGGPETEAARRADALTAAELKAAPGQAVHVRTSALIYDRNRGVASTDQRVILRYGGMECTAVGADFNSDESTVQLRSQVQMSGVAHGQPLYVVADHAEMNRDSNTATLMRPVVSSSGRTAGADNAVLHLRKDGSIERVEAAEHVILRSPLQVVEARQLDAQLNAQMLPERARFSGGVVLTGTDPARRTHGSAKAVDLLFNSQGLPTLMTANGGAKLTMVDSRTAARGLTRSMEGATIVARFSPGDRRSSVRLTEIEASGGGHAMGEAMDAKAEGGPSLKTTQVWGDDLRMTLVKGAGNNVAPQELYANGHTRLQRDGALGEQETSRGDRLEISFGSGEKNALEVTSAQQSGQVVIRNTAAMKTGGHEPGAVSTASADQASLDGATQRLALSGNAHLDGDEASLSAPSILMDQVTQDAEAKGGVQATMRGEQQDRASKPATVTHVFSATARFDHAGKIAEFRGTDAQPARMWQDASQVQAATLLFDGARRTFSARPAIAGTPIQATFASASGQSKAGVEKKPPEVVRVASPKLDYNDVLREATFGEGVVIGGAGVGDVRGQRAVVFLAPVKKDAPAGMASPLGGSIDRVVLSGDVRLEQPGRRGTGEQLLYTAASGSYVLTGSPASPPHIMDAQQGNVTGATLLFGDAGSTIVVAGDTGAAKAKNGRVHSEMIVRPKSEERQ